ncbi:hypothetical protein LSAT2_015403 [Lamellibrachia satsuma]|nr:hypothetical protein LSAT2_015403 [Lamellibrachia satsuma]
MKELEVELEELRLLVVAMVGREQGGCASSSGRGTVYDKVGKDTRDARESSPQPGRKLRGGKVTGRRETGRKETGRKGTGGKTTGVMERGVGETGGKEKGVGETGGKTTGVKERGVGETRAKEWEVGDTGAKETGGKGSGQNVMEGIEWKSYSAAVIEGVRKTLYHCPTNTLFLRVFVGDSIVRKTARVLNKGDDMVVCLPGANIEAITERVKNIVGSGHLQLIDFGLAKRLESGQRTRTICGTLHYIAPEILSTWPYGHSVDWWSLGIMMYALLAGHFPVHGARDHAEMAKCVATHIYDLPVNQAFSWQARKCTRKLLRRNPSSRTHDLKMLQKEAFFRELNFDSLLCKETSCSLLLSAFADGHEISSPRYHSSIMDIFLNDSLLSAKQRCVSVDDDADWPQFTDTMSRAMSVDTFLDSPQTQLNQSLISEPPLDTRPRQHQHMRLRSEDLGHHRRSHKKTLSPTVWSALQQATGQQYYSQPKITRSTGALLNSSWQQHRRHRMRPLATSASTEASLDAMSDDALDRSREDPNATFTWNESVASLDGMLV